MEIDWSDFPGRSTSEVEHFLSRAAQGFAAALSIPIGKVSVLRHSGGILNPGTCYFSFFAHVDDRRIFDESEAFAHYRGSAGASVPAKAIPDFIDV
jgi:hypothetical protein